MLGTEFATRPDVSVEIRADHKITKFVAESLQGKWLVDKPVVNVFSRSGDMQHHHAQLAVPAVLEHDEGRGVGQVVLHERLIYASTLTQLVLAFPVKQRDQSQQRGFAHAVSAGERSMPIQLQFRDSALALGIDES